MNQDDFSPTKTLSPLSATASPSAPLSNTATNSGVQHATSPSSFLGCRPTTTTAEPSTITPSQTDLPSSVKKKSYHSATHLISGGTAPEFSLWSPGSDQRHYFYSGSGDLQDQGVEEYQPPPPVVLTTVRPPLARSKEQTKRRSNKLEANQTSGGHSPQPPTLFADPHVTLPLGASTFTVSDLTAICPPSKRREPIRIDVRGTTSGAPSATTPTNQHANHHSNERSGSIGVASLTNTTSSSVYPRARPFHPLYRGPQGPNTTTYRLPQWQARVAAEALKKKKTQEELWCEHINNLKILRLNELNKKKESIELHRLYKAEARVSDKILLLERLSRSVSAATSQPASRTRTPLPVDTGAPLSCADNSQVTPEMIDGFFAFSVLPSTAKFSA